MNDNMETLFYGLSLFVKNVMNYFNSTNESDCEYDYCDYDYEYECTRDDCNV
jgi:hypothetical protein